MSLDFLQKVATALEMKSLPLGAAAMLEAGASATARALAVRARASLDELLAVLTEPSNVAYFPEPRTTSDQIADRPPRHRTPITFEEETATSELREALKNPGKGSEVEWRPTYRSADAGKYVKRRGYVAAGVGAFEDALSPEEEKTRQIPDHYWELGAREAIVARGDSMRGVGIVNRDLLFVRPLTGGEKPKNRDIVVINLNGRQLVKIWDKKGEKVRLLSANPKFPPIELGPGDETKVFGVVVGRSGYGLLNGEG